MSSESGFPGYLLAFLLQLYTIHSYIHAHTLSSTPRSDHQVPLHWSFQGRKRPVEVGKTRCRSILLERREKKAFRVQIERGCSEGRKSCCALQNAYFETVHARGNFSSVLLSICTPFISLSTSSRSTA